MDGTKVIVPDSLELITPYVLQEQGDWFEDEIKFLRRLVRPDDIVVDIGANYGVYALSLARRVGPNGQLWAFEPARQTAALLNDSARANGLSWLRVVQQALSDREGIAWLQTPGHAELNSLAATQPRDVGDQRVSGEEVQVTTLDQCLEAYGWRGVDLLKIDAEGEEGRILEGGHRLFREFSPLVMFEVKAGAELNLHLAQQFEQLGYRCFRLIPGLDALAPFSTELPVDDYLLNLFAAKPERVAALAAGGWLVDQAEAVSLDPAAFEQHAWLEHLQAMAYAQPWAARWSSHTHQPERPLMARALAAWAASQERDAAIAWRHGALAHSLALLQQACRPSCNPSRWASLARVALASGERGQAVRALNSLMQELQSGRSVDLSEPFLSPDPAFEVIEPKGPVESWLEAAGLSALEQFGSFSSFYTGAQAISRLERLQSLGYSHGALQRRIALVQQRQGSPLQDVEMTTAVRPWFEFLGLEQPLRCVDAGALALEGVTPPWVRWAEEGCAEVLGFEPLDTECKRLNRQAKASGAAIRYWPFALGDGEEHTLYITNQPMTSSLFPPARSTVDLFPALGEWMQVEQRVRVQTHRLDDLQQAQGAEFLKLDVQGAELMILKHAQEVLKSVAVIQCEVEFVELYEGQPLMAEVDTFLRSHGFTFLHFSYIEGRAFKPMQITDKPQKEISQMLWGDAVYVRDFRMIQQWSSRQLQAAAFILHEVYEAMDLTAILLNELDRREQSDLASCYLGAVMINRPDLQCSGEWPQPLPAHAEERATE
ncbi:FkbM family methyltransferase [Synechococcus sp. CBW1006]|uniref:FkbM family methyltransferase n=1 Tax=Synechococcus sp. CBW1006 TaxID=1353138 RepID=UPI001E3CB850|nr:FkbM family methyltransferase [Synechococcus sp. CBW1006]